MLSPREVQRPSEALPEAKSEAISEARLSSLRQLLGAVKVAVLAPCVKLSCSGGGTTLLAGSPAQALPLALVRVCLYAYTYTRMRIRLCLYSYTSTHSRFYSLTRFSLPVRTCTDSYAYAA